MANGPSSLKKRTFTPWAFIKGVGGGTLGAAVAPALLARDKIPSGRAGGPDVFERKSISLVVNGRPVRLQVESRETLLHVLRERLELTGTKRTCGRGECGACTVLLDSTPVYSCLVLAARADGKKVTTVEGLASREALKEAKPLGENAYKVDLAATIAARPVASLED